VATAMVWGGGGVWLGEECRQGRGCGQGRTENQLHPGRNLYLEWILTGTSRDI
jgi:hypothetical protein